MATASLIRPYLIENFPELAPLLDEMRGLMDAFPKFRERIIIAIDDGDDGFSRAFQIEAPASERQRFYSFGELIESYQNETEPQRIIAANVREVLLGPLGMFRRLGGGSPMPLQRDLLIGWIVQRSENIEIGPIIAGGRHRFMALQILIKAAAPNADISKLLLRCSTRHFRTRDELVRAIFADQEGRTMSRAEKRERGAVGLDMTSMDGLRSCLAALKRDDYPVALGGFVRLCAIEKGLDGLTLDQFAAAGVTAYNTLKRHNKGLNQRVYDSQGSMLADLGETACRCLPTVLSEVAQDKSRGPKNSKLAKALACYLAMRHDLSYVA